MPMLALQPVCAPSQEAVGLAGRTTVFFAGILPTATTHELTTLFSSFGVLVGGVNLFKPYKGSIMSKVCLVRLHCPGQGQHTSWLNKGCTCFRKPYCQSGGAVHAVGCC